MKLSNENIKFISEQLDSGMLVYINMMDNTIKALPNEDDMDYYEENPFQKDIDDVASWKNVFVLEPLESFICYRFMEDFLEHVQDSYQRSRLQYALNHRRPFAHFEDLIYQFELKEKWFPYREEQYQQEVINNLPAELRPDLFVK
jgi:deoxyribodipyrimidine photolyase